MSEIFVIDSETYNGVENQLKEAKTTMMKKLNDASNEQLDVPAEVGNEVKKDPRCFAVIINGYSLVSSIHRACTLFHRIVK